MFFGFELTLLVNKADMWAVVVRTSPVTESVPCFAAYKDCANVKLDGSGEKLKLIKPGCLFTG